MRYIDLDDLTFPEGWKEKAERLTNALKACANATERKAIIDKSANQIWKELKDHLALLSSDKCWYSEARDIMSDRDVDHFRPKKSSIDYDGQKYEGYWWLSFDYKNYRFSSEYSNRPRNAPDGSSRGKHDHFPLKAGSFRASLPTEDCRLEEPYLLDPVVVSDILLLTFDDTGAAIPNPIYSEDSWEHLRAKESIKRYHLDYRLIVEAREKIWKEVQNLIHQTDSWLNSEVEGPMIRGDIERNMRKLRKMVRKDAVLSSAAIASLRSSHINWARALAAA